MPASPLFTFSTSRRSDSAVKLQQFLNSIPGISIAADGYPGKNTSDAFRKVFGAYLPGDPRLNDSDTPSQPDVSDGPSDNTENSGTNDNAPRYFKLIPFFQQKEGGLTRNTNDSASSYPCPTPYNGQTGWHTNKGITYKTWVAYFGANADARFFAMSDEDWGHILKAGYWDKVNADKIVPDSIAYTIVSWAWGSGPGTAARQMQKVVGVKQDGVVGNDTLNAINSYPDETELFDKCLAARENFFRSICDPANATTDSQKKQYERNKTFLKGWLNRLAAFSKEFRPS